MALASPRLREALVNTLTLAATRQGLAFVVGVLIAWLIARTDLPGRGWLEFGFWVANFLPVLTVTLGWILIFDDFRGLANQALERLPFVEQGPFNVFSWWGIVWVHLATTTIPIKIMLLVPAFRNLDAALEEASRAAGAGTWRTLRHVTVPVLAPAIVIVMLLGTIRSLEAFEVELILGVPQHIDVYSTMVYREIFQQPPQYGIATALSMVMLAILLPCIVVQRQFTTSRGHATLSGRSSGRLQRLGRWRWPAFALVAGLVLTMTVLPCALVVLSSFLKLFGFFDIEQPWTLAHWQSALSIEGFVAALRNTLLIAGGSALLAMPTFFGIAYIMVRTRYAGRAALDWLSWLPAALPGILVGLGYLWLFLQVPGVRALYGTIWVLLVVVVLGSMPLGVQLLKAGMVQLGGELEEASRACGASAWYTLRRVVVPLVAPALVVVGVLTFAAAARSTSHIALLATPTSKPLALLQLDFMADGSFEAAAVVGVVILVLTIGVALAARLVGLRVGAGGDSSS